MGLQAVAQGLVVELDPGGMLLGGLPDLVPVVEEPPVVGVVALAIGHRALRPHEVASGTGRDRRPAVRLDRGSQRPGRRTIRRLHHFCGADTSSGLARVVDPMVRVRSGKWVT